MKGLLIGLLVLGSVSAFAQSSPNLEIYGQKLSDFNYDEKTDFSTTVSAQYAHELPDLCGKMIDAAKKFSATDSGNIHGLLLKKEIGSKTGVCLVKNRLNY